MIAAPIYFLTPKPLFNPMPELYIISECYIDTTLLETLVPPADGYNHQKGCNNVANVMKNKFTDSFAVGIMDDDKRKNSYIKEFECYVSNGTLHLYKHCNKHHYIIFISPAIEQFMLNCAKEAMINPEDFKLPPDLNSLRRITKNITSKKDPAFKKLFEAIKDTGDCKRLKAWLEYLKLNKYDCEKGGFSFK
jgi:hypothetical protein